MGSTLTSQPGVRSASGTLRPGDPDVLGARCTEDGVLFSVYSARAEALELCLFDAAGKPARREHFDVCDDGVWHGFLPGAQAGMRYGFRAHGRFAPEEGLYFNPNRLLLDPYARAMAGRYVAHPANHLNAEVDEFTQDNFAWVPHGVIVGELDGRESGVGVSDQMRVLYEAHTAGLTQLNSSVPAPLRGCFSGVATPAIINHLRALGVTSLQLLPVHSYIDEPHLLATDLTNYWGYNSLNFFTPHAGYVAVASASDAFVHDRARRQFRDMVRALHDANIEVLLDVVYNHTCEGGADGPVLSFRGLDNLAYYRTDALDNHSYINDTGCGNTLDFMSPVVQRLTLDSLRYFTQAMEVDGFRFDLAVTLGREPEGFNPRHELFEAMRNDPVLSRCTLIAEPWDVGPGGYQTGGFASPWLEWNDRYRDALRSFWRGDAGAQAEMGKRLHGSSDLFENGGRGVSASINFVASHDGFTLADVVAFAERHNEANGEENRDGHAHNLSDNMGEEGVSDDPNVRAARDRRSRAMLATLIFSQGTPMLLGGDELRNSQQGNNNAYCQDNPTGWLQWDALSSAHVNLVRRCIDVRAGLDGFRVTHFVHKPWSPEAPFGDSAGDVSVGWLRSDGLPMRDSDWQHDAAPVALPFAQLLSGPRELVLIALNPTFEDCRFVLPLAGIWQCRIDSTRCSGRPTLGEVDGCAVVGAQSLCLFSITAVDSGQDQPASQIHSAPHVPAPSGTTQ